MKFGPVATADAAGAYLAHSIKLDRGALKKGRRLSDDDVATLVAAGIESVVTARLEAGDIHEDAAARRIAEVLKGPGLRASEAFTGRVNLFAEEPGLLEVDPAAIDKINAIHESVTVATLPAFASLATRQMVATIKIIPFAAPAAAVEAAEAVAQAGRVIGIKPYRRLRVGLIQSTLPSVKESVLNKTVEITTARIEALGGQLIGERRVPHDAQAIADAIQAADELSADLLLIAGASAIVDRADALPAGIEAAGGTVNHFGMPVDPGNLIMLAERAGRPIVGLPGCARSPKLNGFDWVLQRIAAGVAVAAKDIQAMGVGGLLAEIGARPLPRAAATRGDHGKGPSQPRVWALVLAAGQSRRMGEANKLLEPVDGKPMALHAVDAALGADVAGVTVVTGHQADTVRKALEGREVSFAHNPEFARGLSASLKVAAVAAPDDIDAAIVLLGDMPRVSSAHVDRLIAAFNPLEGRAICVPTRNGKRGNPVLWARRFLDEMAALEGDVGAKSLIGQHEDLVTEVEMADAAVLHDVDTPAALAEIRGTAGKE